jgi:large conductance mechanosensitive channel
MAKKTVDVVEGAVSGRLDGFFAFIREQGIVGLAIGLVMGTAVKEVIDTFVKSFIDPLVGLIVPTKSLATASFSIEGRVFVWGAFVSVLIRFVAIAAVVYFFIMGLKLDKLDRKKDTPKKN